MSNTPVPPYGVALTEALASGDLVRMRKVVVEAEAYLKHVGDVGQLLKAVRTEIQLRESSLGGGVPPYGDALRAAAFSGDVDRMRESVKNAEIWLARVSDVQNALADVKIALSKHQDRNKL